jgi:hypothetical protein
MIRGRVLLRDGDEFFQVYMSFVFLFVQSVAHHLVFGRNLPHNLEGVVEHKL